MDRFQPKSYFFLPETLIKLLFASEINLIRSVLAMPGKFLTVSLCDFIKSQSEMY